VPPETLFRIEGELVRDAVGRLSEKQRERIRERVEDSERTLCPLLEDGACSIYESRPMICRTQGLPLAQQNGDEAFELDYCRLNFVTVPQDFELERRHILNLDGTNEILARINLKLVNAAGLDPEQDGRVCFAKAAVGRMVGVPTPVSKEAASAQGPQPGGGALV
jgi:Fe-S-cluster containining protein